MKKPSPLVQMTMALVALCSTLVLLGAVFLDVMPDRQAQERAVRKAVSEALAVQIADMLKRDEPRTIEKSMATIVGRTDNLRSVGVRRADGTLLLKAGPHETQWQLDDSERSRPEQVTVPLHANSERWGRIEVAFAADSSGMIASFFREPLVQMLIFVGVAGWLVFGLYMRRALQHLDPSSVVPERVQGAFDAMAEGVVVLDARGRLMLSNKSFRDLHPDLAEIATGTSLSVLPWLAGCLPTDPMQHPWTRAMSERVANAGTTLEAGHGNERRWLVLNAAPIGDAGGSVRGCMVTFNDMSALHRANDALRDAMHDLAVAKQEVEIKNVELETLATRDPLTGLLNRRAFQLAFDKALGDAVAHGTSLSCMVVDIDHFKSINDAHGHSMGDRVIQEVARKLQESARATDLVCRWGGEEFCVVVTHLSAAESFEFAERLRMRIERECGAGVREVPGLHVTASVGLSMATAVLASVPALVDNADQALYRAKRAGRNRVMSDAVQAAADARDADYSDTESGCLNAEGFAATIRSLRENARSEDRVLGCVMVSIDDAKALAEAYGEAALLTATVHLTRVLRDAAPQPAIVARLDDRRVVAVMQGRGLADCESLAAHVQERAEHSLAVCFAGAAPRSVRISAGVDAVSALSPGAAMLTERAEQALNRRRRSGGNGVTLFVAPRSAGAGPSSQALQLPPR